MTSKGMRLFIWGFVLLWVAVMIVFSFADLSLSKALYNEEHSLFGQFLKTSASILHLLSYLSRAAFSLVRLGMRILMLYSELKASKHRCNENHNRGGF